MVKNPPASAGDIKTWAGLLGREDPLEEGMTTHSSILAWGIPRSEEPATVMGLQRARLDRVTNTLGFPSGTSGKEPA